jgi:hypothetical protein
MNLEMTTTTQGEENNQKKATTIDEIIINLDHIVMNGIVDKQAVCGACRNCPHSKSCPGIEFGILAVKTV